MSFYKVSASIDVKATRKVSYQCENCGGEFSYNYTLKRGGYQQDITGKHFHTQTATKLQGDAYIEAVDALKKEITTMNEKKDYGYEKCPGCGYTQSWMQSSQISKTFITPFIIVTMVLVAAAFIVPASELFPISLALSCVSSFVLWVVICLIIIGVSSKRLKNSDKEFGDIKIKNTPTVVWSDPEVVS